MVKTSVDLNCGIKKMLAHAGEETGATIEVVRVVAWPVREPNDGALELCYWATAISSELDFELTQ